TILCSVLLAAGLLMVAMFTLIKHREEDLRAPEMYVEQVTSRELDAEEYTNRLAPWEKLLNNLAGVGPHDALNDAIDAYEDCSKISDWNRLRRTTAVFLAEAGRFDEAQQDLEFLEPDQFEADIVAATRFAYGNGSP